MNHNLIDLAEEKGLVAPESIQAIVSRLPPKDLLRLAGRTIDAITSGELQRPAGSDDVGSSFMASASIRGDAGCSEWGCRSKKLDALSRYTALYADHLVIPVSARSFFTHASVLRRTVIDFYSQVSQLRPLVERNRASFVADMMCLCADCSKRFNSACEAHHRAAREFYYSKLDQIQLIYRPPVRKIPWHVEVLGPEELVEHGCMHSVPAGNPPIPSWVPKRLTRIGDQQGALLSPSKIKKNRILVGRMFSQLSKDAIFQQYFGVRAGVSYLTNSILEAEFLQSIYPRPTVDNSVSILLEEMQHSIPLLSEVPLRTALAIREEDPDSFLLYRNSISQLVHEYMGNAGELTKARAKQICEDILGPQLLRLRLEARAKTRSAFRKSTAKAAVPAAMLTLGLVSGLVPHVLREIFTLGGIALTGQLAETIASIEQNPAEIKSHNLYYLLRLTQSSE